MLTIDDVAAVPLFSGLPATELERLARTSADLHLGPGEFAVPEGGERALFAVLSGKIEVVKTIDGIERRLGWRVPGTIFGEVPIALGTPFPGGYRAVEPSRVMRVDAQQYYAIAAVSQDISLKVSALARERLGGLQSIAAEPPTPRVTVVGHRWDTACGDLRRFLARNQISFNWVTPDAPELATLWPGPRPGGRRSARCSGSRTDRCSSGRTCAISPIASACRPAHAPTSTTSRSSAADRPALRRRSTAPPKGCARSSSSARRPADRPGRRRGSRTISDFRAASPATNWRAVRSSKRGASARRSWSRAPSHASIRRRAKSLLDGGDVVRARTLILATGVTWRRLAIEGFDRLIGKGVYYGAARSEVGATHGLDIHLVGAGNSAGQAALYFANHARSVTLVVRGESLDKSMSHYLIEQLRRKIEHRGAAAVGSPRGPRRHAPDGDRHSRQPKARRCAGTSAAACSSSSAPTRRPSGCRRRSRATRAAMC